MRKYDPDKAPNPREWLALDEQERMNLVKRSVLAEHVWGVVNENKLEPDANEAYFAALDGLTVESWHEAYRDQD